jgi:transketolase
MRRTCFETVLKLQKKNKKIIFIGSDLGPGFMKHSKDKVPERFFMEGVSEQSIIGMSAGLALEGYLPFVNTIATFLTRRCFEQIVIDLCLHDLPVKLIGNGGGLVYAPLGPTHQAIEDISILRTLPNMTILAPCDANEMKNLIPTTLKWPHPVYIRLSRGDEPLITEKNHKFVIGKSVIIKKPEDCLFLSTGIASRIALNASKKLDQEYNIKSGVIHFPTIKPLDTQTLAISIKKAKKIITVEENVLLGGFGSSILEFCSDHLKEHLHKISRVGLKDAFVDDYGDQSSLLNKYGITEAKLVNKMLKLIKND